MADKDYYLLTYYPDTGGLEAHRVSKNANGSLRRYGPMHVSDVPIPALAIGLKVLALAGDRPIEEPRFDILAEGPLEDTIVIGVLPVEPPEKVGVEYLRTLTRGSLWRWEHSGGFMISRRGISFASDGELKTWDMLDAEEGFNQLNASNCHPWAPEQPKGKE